MAVRLGCWKNCLLKDPSCGSAGKESPCKAGGPGSIPGNNTGIGCSQFPGEGKGYPLQYSDLDCKELDTTANFTLKDPSKGHLRMGHLNLVYILFSRWPSLQDFAVAWKYMCSYSLPKDKWRLSKRQRTKICIYYTYKANCSPYRKMYWKVCLQFLSENCDKIYLSKCRIILLLK